MATKEEITKGLGKLEANYGLPPQLVDDATTAVFLESWQERFGKVDGNVFAEAIELVINKRFRFPNIADMFQALAEVGYRPSVGARLRKPMAVYRDVLTGKTMAVGAVKDKSHLDKITLADDTVMVKVWEEESGDASKNHHENHGGASASKSK